MKVFNIRDIDEIVQDNKKRVVALGFFDGVHKGHQTIINKTVEYAVYNNIIPILITFDISPKEYFSRSKLGLLTTKTIKTDILKSMNIEEVYFLEFNDILSTTTREEFIDKVLLKLGVTSVFCGQDYAFGYKGEGRPMFINEYSKQKISVQIVETKLNKNEKISSSTLKERILKGDILSFKENTGREYKLVGKVIKGKQLGRTINFPTANLELEDRSLLLPQGVYITRVKINNKIYIGMTNIGNNPTVTTSGELFIETHILNFDEEIYGEFIELSFLKFLRKEKKFNSLDELKKQLAADKKSAEEYF